MAKSGFNGSGRVKIISCQPPSMTLTITSELLDKYSSRKPTFPTHLIITVH